MAKNDATFDELGAHVSAAGGVDKAPARARELGSVVLQLFTKQPSRWAEPVIPEETVAAFRREREALGIRTAVAHDSYLINLGSPDPALWERSYGCFAGELSRAVELGLEYVVTHPGNATDGDFDGGFERNARGVARALEEVPGATVVLLELTAGTGNSLGGSFEHLAEIIERIPEPLRGRVGVCFDTCHAYAAGYDLVGDYDRVFDDFDRLLGLDRLAFFHLNDSKTPLGSRRDRHDNVGDGTLGVAPFRRLLLDPRFRSVPKVLETPKGDDPPAADLRNLALLRSLRAGAGSGTTES